MNIEFRNVGRGKRTWTAEISEEGGEHYICERLLREIKKSKALGSRGIDIQYDPGTWDGEILVGGFRPVGTFRVASSANASLGETK
jgi:hypothetical protein